MLQCDFLKGLVLKEYGAQNSDIDLGIALRNKTIDFCFFMQSVPLWCDYLNFVQEHDPAVRECSSEGILKARNLFERALTAAGLHVAEGSKIWEVYREFEQAILLTIDENDNEVRIYMHTIDVSLIFGIFFPPIFFP